MLPQDCNAPKIRNSGEGLGCGFFCFWTEQKEKLNQIEKLIWPKSSCFASDFKCN